MKICIISPLFDPWLIGGAEKYITTLSNALSSDNDILVITTAGPKRRVIGVRDNMPRVIEINPTNVLTIYDAINNAHRVGITKKVLWHMLDLWNVSTYRHLNRILNEERPDIVHTNGIKGLSASLFPAIKRSKIPHIHTLHDYELISRWSSLFRRHKAVLHFNAIDKIYYSFMRQMSSTIDAVISPSKFVMDFHADLGFFKHSEKHIIPNGLRLIPDRAVKDNSTKEFLFMGQITEHKGPQIAIQAFRMLEDAEARLHIVGQGNFLDHIRDMISGDDRIVIHGFVT